MELKTTPHSAYLCLQQKTKNILCSDQKITFAGFYLSFWYTAQPINVYLLPVMCTCVAYSSRIWNTWVYRLAIMALSPLYNYLHIGNLVKYFSMTIRIR